MVRVVGRLVLIVPLLLPSGCRAVAEGVCECLWDAAYSAMIGESSEERDDRHRVEEYKEFWATPGRTEYEIETEARGTFRRTYGRDPK